MFFIRESKVVRFSPNRCAGHRSRRWFLSVPAQSFDIHLRPLPSGIGDAGVESKIQIRKLYYNMTITATSIAIAVLIGALEGLGLLAEKLNLHGAVWDAIALFVLFWTLSAINYRRKNYDALAVKRKNRLSSHQRRCSRAEPISRSLL